MEYGIQVSHVMDMVKGCLLPLASAIKIDHKQKKKLPLEMAFPLFFLFFLLPLELHY